MASSGKETADEPMDVTDKTPDLNEGQDPSNNQQTDRDPGPSPQTLPDRSTPGNPTPQPSDAQASSARPVSTLQVQQGLHQDGQDNTKQPVPSSNLDRQELTDDVIFVGERTVQQELLKKSPAQRPGAARPPSDKRKGPAGKKRRQSEAEEQQQYPIPFGEPPHAGQQQPPRGVPSISATGPLQPQYMPGPSATAGARWQSDRDLFGNLYGPPTLGSQAQSPGSMLSPPRPYGTPTFDGRRRASVSKPDRSNYPSAFSRDQQEYPYQPPSQQHQQLPSQMQPIPQWQPPPQFQQPMQQSASQQKPSAQHQRTSTQPAPSSFEQPARPQTPSVTPKTNRVNDASHSDGRESTAALLQDSKLIIVHVGDAPNTVIITKYQRGEYHLTDLAASDRPTKWVLLNSAEGEKYPRCADPGCGICARLRRELRDDIRKAARRGGAQRGSGVQADRFGAPAQTTPSEPAQQRRGRIPSTDSRPPSTNENDSSYPERGENIPASLVGHELRIAHSAQDPEAEVLTQYRLGTYTLITVDAADRPRKWVRLDSEDRLRYLRCARPGCRDCQAQTAEQRDADRQRRVDRMLAEQEQEARGAGAGLFNDMTPGEVARQVILPAPEASGKPSCNLMEAVRYLWIFGYLHNQEMLMEYLGRLRAHLEPDEVRRQEEAGLAAGREHARVEAERQQEAAERGASQGLAAMGPPRLSLTARMEESRRAAAEWEEQYAAAVAAERGEDQRAAENQRQGNPKQKDDHEMEDI